MEANGKWRSCRKEGIVSYHIARGGKMKNRTVRERESEFWIKT